MGMCIPPSNQIHCGIRETNSWLIFESGMLYFGRWVRVYDLVNIFWLILH
ncbi:hypothetical protein KP509_03G063800 [Ceratopteris richardii]|uniref:Uncharacterized protein n=1 Tax=Ceratopteris richardii TaxID=49495 RepID=A0A8T2V0L7_CERRI|nr:hypothetical protein KP509_03G063800 [Ceratopteris richardii]